MEGVWSCHTEAALLILGLGSILTRQYLRAAKAWQVQGKGREKGIQPVPTGELTSTKIAPLKNLSQLLYYSQWHPGPFKWLKMHFSLKS